MKKHSTNQTNTHTFLYKKYNFLVIGFEETTLAFKKKFERDGSGIGS